MPDTYNIYDEAVTIFPSSNATSEGKITSEPNLRGIVTRLKISNYVVNEGTGLTLEGTVLKIPRGYSVNIDGYLLEFEATSIGSVPANCSIYIELRFNSLDGLLYGKEDDPTYTHGAIVTFTEPDPGVQYIKIGDVTGGTLSTDDVNHFPISSDIIANGETNTSLTDYINTGASELYVSKINNDTKKKNLKFVSDDLSDQTNIVVDNSKINVNNNETTLMSIQGSTIRNTTVGSITFDSTNNILKVSGNQKVTIDANGTSIAVENNKVTIGNIVLNLSGSIVSIEGATDVIIGKQTEPQNVTLYGDLTVNGDITGDRVFGAVFN